MAPSEEHPVGVALAAALSFLRALHDEASHDHFASSVSRAYHGIKQGAKGGDRKPPATARAGALAFWGRFQDVGPSYCGLIVSHLESRGLNADISEAAFADYLRLVAEESAGASRARTSAVGATPTTPARPAHRVASTPGTPSGTVRFDGHDIRRRGGTYAILLALQAQAGNPWRTKQEICELAQPHCDTPMALTAGSPYSGFSSMGTLRSNGWVEVSGTGRGALYALTASGKAAAAAARTVTRTLDSWLASPARAAAAPSLAAASSAAAGAAAAGNPAPSESASGSVDAGSAAPPQRKRQRLYEEAAAPAAAAAGGAAAELSSDDEEEDYASDASWEKALLKRTWQSGQSASSGAAASSASSSSSTGVASLSTSISKADYGPPVEQWLCRAVSPTGGAWYGRRLTPGPAAAAAAGGDGLERPFYVWPFGNTAPPTSALAPPQGAGLLVPCLPRPAAMKAAPAGYEAVSQPATASGRVKVWLLVDSRETKFLEEVSGAFGSALAEDPSLVDRIGMRVASLKTGDFVWVAEAAAGPASLGSGAAATAAGGMAAATASSETGLELPADAAHLRQLKQQLFMLGYIVERKSVDDFVVSLFHNRGIAKWHRFGRQKRELLASGLARPFLLVEGDPSTASPPFANIDAVQPVQQALADAAVDGVTVLRTADKAATARKLLAMTKLVQREAEGRADWAHPSQSLDAWEAHLRASELEMRQVLPVWGAMLCLVRDELASHGEVEAVLATFPTPAQMWLAAEGRRGSLLAGAPAAFGVAPQREPDPPVPSAWSVNRAEHYVFARSAYERWLAASCAGLRLGPLGGPMQAPTLPIAATIKAAIYGADEPGVGAAAAGSGAGGRPPPEIDLTASDDEG